MVWRRMYWLRGKFARSSCNIFGPFPWVLKFYAYLCIPNALVAELVDAPDLGSGVARRVGSSPIRRTQRNPNCLNMSS